ncbi:16S rRNA (cytosine(967)-C(5))-methyltransferase RsmB [Clostridium grantii]|uniref:16S rRNA (cytosine(967)-C(5))-methyltransferase n=1 Tax=Clostridium grantii DSM 8605 TaxID=1121316 RepID=A0A1M5QTB6_9CLOT|nr:16S rRNA (cytosine(967)-C(5))-methyltransferase RsmB [Clostridium grantii]SHH17374.1 16S rRNA (cytosine967-C5)-methyltransferase [Clostridium grantii DSM 8605]
MKSTRELAVETLTNIFVDGLYSNIYLSKVLNESEINEKDRGLFTEIIYGTLRYKYTIDKILDSFLKDGTKKMSKNDPLLLNVLRISIYQIKYLDKIPPFAAVNEAVEITKKRCGMPKSKLVNGVLRNYLRNKEKPDEKLKKSYTETLSFEHSFENWMVKLLLAQYSKEDVESILNGLNQRPEITVRVNSLKADYDTVVESLSKLEYSIKEGEVSPEAIYIRKGSNVEKNPLFNEGLITIQDESAMLVAEVMELKDNLKVLDLCSAPGGKTTHIAELMNNTGNIIACDIYDHKLKLVKDNIERLGIENVELMNFDATVYNEKFVNYADRVLIDVPCSGLGIIRKKPEIKWNKNKNELDALIKIQKDILVKAADYVKSGGYLIYSTCTLNKNENIKNISWFLEKDDRFEIEKIFLGNLSNLRYDNLGTLTILPNENMDGFYIARLKRK